MSADPSSHGPADELPAIGNGSVRGKFPRIGELGFLSDCHTSALVAPDGSVEWMCLPRFDSPSIFGALLDRDAGLFRFGPAASVPVARRYVPGTNLLETTWSTGRGWLVVTDALIVGAWRERSDDPHVRTPSDHDAERLLIRTARCVQGEVDVSLVCELLGDYGRTKPDWELADDRDGATARIGELGLGFATDLRLGLEAGRLEARHTLRDGEGCFCALGWSADGDLPADLEDARRRIDQTGEFWRAWLEAGSFPDHPWRIHLQRSALTLKGLIYSPTGATVAAATTSLPETPGGERNWDYRYTWIRDATFTLWGLHILGLDAEARDFMAFIGEICRDVDRLQIMYGLGGERELTESTLDHLSGYEGAQPVRVGNAAYDQRQNDLYGALLDSLYIHTKVNDHLRAEAWGVVEGLVDKAIAVWREPDQGIWEARGEPRHYVSSKLMCWVALDRGARLAEWRGETELAERWLAESGEIKAEILDRGVSERGVLRQHYETDSLDASILLAPLLRFLPADDERIRDTVLAIADELTEDGLVLRYRTDETDDGLSGVEGTFTICSCWLVSALSEIGETERARELCERLVIVGGTLGLYAEEIQPGTGAQLGNFPQAFTHLALINAVSHVIADELHAPGRGGMTAVFSEMRGA